MTDHDTPGQMLDMMQGDAVSAHAYADARSEYSVDQPDPIGPLAGDHADDDGVALSQYFEVNPNNSGNLGVDDNPYDDLYKNGQHSAYSDQTVPQDEIRECTRLVTFNLVMSPGDTQIALPRDPNRTQLYIYTFSNPATGSAYAAITVSSDKPSTVSLDAVFNGVVMAGSGTPMVLEGHTGAVWIHVHPLKPGGAANTDIVSVYGVAITK